MMMTSPPPPDLPYDVTTDDVTHRGGGDPKAAFPAPSPAPGSSLGTTGGAGLAP